jgi:hypothetical protein
MGIDTGGYFKAYSTGQYEAGGKSFQKKSDSRKNSLSRGLCSGRGRWTRSGPGGCPVECSAIAQANLVSRRHTEDAPNRPAC